MPNMTIFLPDELKRRMERHRTVRWSNLFRTVVERELNDFEKAEAIARKSKLTEKDLEKIKPFVDEDMREHGRKLLARAGLKFGRTAAKGV